MSTVTAPSAKATATASAPAKATAKTTASAPAEAAASAPAGTEPAPDMLSPAVIDNPAAGLPVPQDFFNYNAGETFGGNYPRIILEIGQVSPYLIYTGRTSTITTEKGVDGEDDQTMTVDLCELRDKPGTLVSLPAAAILKKCIGEADMTTGDVFAFARHADATKKRGRGAGNKMENYSVKVFGRDGTKARKAVEAAKAQKAAIDNKSADNKAA